MSHEDAVAAIEAAVQADSSDQADPFVSSEASPAGEPTPQVQPSAQPVEPQAPAQPVAPVAPVEQPAVDTFDGGQFNPDELPAELQPGWKQLQAAFTQKTQALAEQQRQLEALGDLESLQQAAELYNRIADPSYWPQLHAELAEAMEQYGLTPAEAAQVAAEAREPELPADLAQLEGDPELAPLLQHTREIQARLDAFEQMQAEREAMEEAERTHEMLVGELMRQANAIRQARPDYSDDDMDAIMQLSSFHNGNLIAAQHAYEEAVQRRIAQYFAGKQAASSEPAVQPPAGAGVESSQEDLPETLEDAEKWAIEHLRQRQAAGEEFAI